MWDLANGKLLRTINDAHPPGTAILHLKVSYIHTHTHVCTAILVRTLIDITHVLAPYSNLHLNLILTLKPSLNPQKVL